VLLFDVTVRRVLRRPALKLELRRREKSASSRGKGLHSGGLHPAGDGVLCALPRIEYQEARIIPVGGLCAQRASARPGNRFVQGRAFAQLPSPGVAIEASVVQKRDSLSASAGRFPRGFGDQCI